MDMFTPQSQEETGKIIDSLRSTLKSVSNMSLADRVNAINAMREEIHKISPFASEPVDFVRWVPSTMVHANDYNPNSVAPPEMELLRKSISSDGYTQPIVGMLDDKNTHEVIDGFHRHRVGKECLDVSTRVHGYLPIVQIRSDRKDKADRMAATIRHNRARGKHKVEAMSDIVIELKRRNWSDEKVSRELGMDPDEVLRLCQITGLAEAFKDQQFSEAWEVGTDEGGSEEILSDVIDGYERKPSKRILHTWEKWECYRAGFYAEHPPKGMTQDDGEMAYMTFLMDLEQFASALDYITTNWKHSCEHYLTNPRMNRVAWLGQAAVAYAIGVPSICRGGYNRLSDSAKQAADLMAMDYLNKWLIRNGMEAVSMADAVGKTEQDLY